MKIVVLVVVSSLLFQGCLPSARELLGLRRPLTADEMDTVVTGIHMALAGTTFRLVRERGTETNREVLIGTRGLPRMIRQTLTALRREANGELIAGVTSADGTVVGTSRFVRLIENTGDAVRHCDGTAATGELVIEYLLDVEAQEWTAKARETHPGDPDLVRPLVILRTPASLRIGESRLAGTRVARAVVAQPPAHTPYPLITGDPAPDPAEFVPVQSLWIDTSSLLPLRWEVSQREAIVAAYDFIYEPLDFQRPTTVAVPTCVSPLP